MSEGVMIALGLIPARGITGWGNFDLGGKAFLRLLIEIVIVYIFSGSFFVE